MSASAGLLGMIIPLLLMPRLLPHTSLTYAAAVCPESMLLGHTRTKRGKRDYILYLLFDKGTETSSHHTDSLCQTG